MNWYQSALDEAETFFVMDEPFTEEELADRAHIAVLGFHHLFEIVLKKAKIRDKWQEPRCYTMPHSTECLERSEKIGIEFKLGISLFGWFIEAPISHTDSIRSMKEDFWEHIVHLSSLGEAKLEDCGRPLDWASTPAAKKLTQHTGSLVYSIARDYTLLKCGEDESYSLGDIHVRLPLDSDEDTVFEFFVQGIKSLYRINYMLYRRSYIGNRRRKR